LKDSKIFFIFPGFNLFLFHHLTNSFEASMKSILLSVLFFFKTIIQVAMLVQKNKSGGNWITASI